MSLFVIESSRCYKSVLPYPFDHETLAYDSVFKLMYKVHCSFETASHDYSFIFIFLPYGMADKLRQRTYTIIRLNRNHSEHRV